MNFVMTPLRYLRERLSSRKDSEHEQAILRIVIAGLVISALSVPGGLANPQVMLGLDAYLALATLLLVAILIWPALNVPRRLIGMVADVGLTTWALFLAGEVGVSWFGIYLFIIFGNGFRYGRAYLFTCQTLCIVGFAAVLIYAPWWRTHPVIGLGLMNTLIVIPLYVSTLLNRIMQRLLDLEQRSVP